MQVTVNGESIDLTLEDERLLGQVVAGIEKWLNGAGMVVTSLRLGDRELASEPDSAWTEASVDGLERLEVTACPLGELERDQLAAIGSYLDAVGASIEARRPLAADAATGFADVAAAARRGLGLVAGSPEARSLSELEQLIGGGAPPEVDAWPAGIRDRALGAVGELREAVRTRLQEIEQPVQALRGAAAGLAESSRDLGDVSLLLQTGRDGQASDLIMRFAARLQSAVRAVSRLGDVGEPAIDARSLRDFVAEINGVLKQTLEAFRARDTVLLGDLLEYEVAPRLERLASLANGPLA